MPSLDNVPLGQRLRAKKRLVKKRKTVHHVRKVVKHRSVKKKPAGETSGGFVQCNWHKKKKPNKAALKKYRKFAAKVKRVLNAVTPPHTTINDYAISIPIGCSSYGGCNWFQIPFCILNESNVVFNPPAGGAKNTLGYLSRDLYNASSNTDCYAPTLGTTSVSNATYLNDLLRCARTFNDIPVETTLSAGSVFQRSYVHADITLKNNGTVPCQLKVYKVKAKRSFMYTREGLPNETGVGVSTMYGGGCLGTPLELFMLGLWERSGTSAGAQDLSSRRATTLLDSPEFTKYWHVKSTCDAYMPAGGIINWSMLNKRKRQFRSNFAADHSFSTDSEFLVVQIRPEPVVGPNGPTNAYVTGFPNPNVPNIPTAADAPDVLSLFASYKTTTKHLTEIVNKSQEYANSTLYGISNANQCVHMEQTARFDT